MRVASKRQEAEVLGGIVRFFPYGRFSSDDLQPFVERPDRLTELLYQALVGVDKKVVDPVTGLAVIDTDADPFVPSGELKVQTHRGMGKMTWKPSRVRFHVSSAPHGLSMWGYHLREEMNQLPALNATVMDFLFENQYLIPEEWRGRTLYFWGTIFANSVGQPIVRYLIWEDGSWHRESRWLGEHWRSDSYALVLTPEDETVKNIIDTNADPVVPVGWKVEQHQRTGQFTWDPTRVRLYYASRQKKGQTINGEDLREKLKGKPVLNANVLDYLFAHQEIIPEKWQKEIVYFWGTIYNHPSGDLVVRRLQWKEGIWEEGYFWLGGVWLSNEPAAVAVQ